MSPTIKLLPPVKFSQSWAPYYDASSPWNSKIGPSGVVLPDRVWIYTMLAEFRHERRLREDALAELFPTGRHRRDPAVMVLPPREENRALVDALVRRLAGRDGRVLIDTGYDTLELATLERLRRGK